MFSVKCKILIIAGLILMTGTVSAQKQVKYHHPVPKETLSPIVRDHLRWVMDEKSWHLPNIADVRAIEATARRGDPSAQFRLSLMYEAGYGVQQNGARAVRWLRKAAEQGFLPAQYDLGSRYVSGDGISQDLFEASNWFRRAAEHGYASAQKNLGAMYARGYGVPQDFNEAYVWSSIATRSGVDGALRNRNLAASELSPDDLQVAEKRATTLFAEIQQRSPEGTDGIN